MAGIAPWDSWDYTWGEGCEAVNAFTRRENDRTKKQAVALYNAAVFLAQSVLAGGKLKEFHEAFPGYQDEAKRSDEMSDDAMYAMVRRLNAKFGGEEE